LKSKIINMADRIKDVDDEMLEALFRAEPIADDGFSERIVRKVRRRLWLKRFTLPAAVAIGAAISLKPLGMLLTTLVGLISALPVDWITPSTAWIPPLPTLVLGGMLFAVFMLGLRMFEE
jgi:hypothetical protein